MIYVGGRKVNINGFANIPINGWVGKYDKSLVISEDNWPKLNEIVDEIDLSDYGITGDYEYKVGYLIGRQSASTVIYTVANEVYLFSDGTSIVGTGNNNVTHTWTDSSPDQGFPDRWVIVCSHEQWCKGYPILTYCYWATGGKAYKQNQAAVNVANRSGYRQSNTPFREMRFLKHIENLKLLVGTGAEYAFRITNSLEDIVNCTWDTNGCKSFTQFFYGCSKLKSISMTGFDTSSNLNCDSMFNQCISLVSIDLSTLDMSNCTSCSSMLTNCQSLVSINTSTWNMLNCVNCGSMFSNCISLTNIDTSNWNLEKCTNCQGMFQNCQALTNIDTSNFNLSKCTSCRTMFSGCSKLQSIGSTTNWNLANCTTCQEMFQGCQSLANIDTINWNLANCTTCSSMFYGCVSLTYVNTTNWNLANCIGINTMFYNCQKLQSIGSTTNWNVSKCKTMQWFMAQCYSIEQIDIVNWNLSACQNISDFVSNCTYLKTLCPNGWIQPLDMSTVTNCNNLIGNTPMLTSIPPFTNVKPGMNVSLNSSPLSRDCVAVFDQAGQNITNGIIYHLNDLTGQTKSTLRLSPTTKNYFTAEERSLIESTLAAKNWTLAW